MSFQETNGHDRLDPRQRSLQFFGYEHTTRAGEQRRDEHTFIFATADTSTDVHMRNSECCCFNLPHSEQTFAEPQAACL